MDVSRSDVLKNKDAIIDGLSEGQKLRLSREVERELALRDTYYLAKYVLGYDKLSNYFHKALCRFYDRNLYQNQLHLHPRKHFKTTLITISGKIRMALLDPNITICINANTLGNSASFLREIRAHYCTNEKFQHLFPEHIPSRKSEEGTTDYFTTPARMNKTIRMHTFEIASVDKAIVSRHYDIISFDDIVDDKNVATADLRQKIYDNYVTSLSTTSINRENLPWHHIVGTRWSFDDLYNDLIEQNRKRPTFKMMITSAYWKEKDPETGSEYTKHLFPEKFPVEALEVLREKQGDYKFSCTPGDATIWMADGTFKRIDEVEVGDQVVGFDRVKDSKQFDRTKLVKTVVKNIQSRVAPVVQEMMLGNGDLVYCTPDHRWYTGRKDRSHRLYKPAEVGSRLIKVIEQIYKQGKRLRVVDSTNLKLSGDNTKPKVCRIKVYQENVAVYALVTGTGNYISQGYASKNCLYLNNPVPEGDITLNPADLQYFSEGSEWLKRRQPFSYMMFVDPAATEKKRKGDPTAIGVFAADAQSNFYIKELIRGWWNPDEIIEKIFALQQAYNIRKIGVEEVCFSKWLSFYMEKAKRDREMRFQIVPIKRSRHSGKKDRHDSIQPFLKNGKILARDDLEEIGQLKKELREYPNGANDDFLDLLADAIAIQRLPVKNKLTRVPYHVPPEVYRSRRGFQTGYTYRAQ